MTTKAPTVREGVIKFAADHEVTPMPADVPADVVRSLIAWRQLLHGLGLIGQDPARYDGAGYGNVSGRLSTGAFVITGTQTGGKKAIAREDFCLVDAFDVRQNRVRSRGTVRPSSESMTHGALYALHPSVAFIFHGHSASLWHAAERLKMPCTRPGVEYGTPEMAREMRRLHDETPLFRHKLFAMKGHEDGVASFGRTAEEAGGMLVLALARALEPD